MTCQEAVNESERDQWIDAIPQKKESLHKNQTWSLVDKEEVKAAQRYDQLVKFDIKMAFLYGHLDEVTCMHLPEGYNGTGKISKLLKALYGLNQAPLKWNNRFTNFLKENSLEPMKSEKQETIL